MIQVYQIEPRRMIAIEDARPLRRRRRRQRWLTEERGWWRVLGHDVVEEPHAEKGGGDAAHGGGDHVRDGGGDLDGHERRDAHEETEDTLHRRMRAEDEWRVMTNVQ